jgi:hypothetical protein
VPYTSGTVYAPYSSKMKGIPSQLQHIIIKPCRSNRLQRLYFSKGSSRRFLDGFSSVRASSLPEIFQASIAKKTLRKIITAYREAIEL